MKQSVISKVYGIRELPKDEKEQYEDRIKQLERSNHTLGRQQREMLVQLQEVVDYLRESGILMRKANTKLIA